MSDLFAARSQFAVSLGFHIIFASIGIGMPLLMVIAEGLWLRTRDETYLILARRWAKGTAILFAIGAVSGTVISFQLGLLWPEFMRFAGAIIGMPFSLEGFAFFTEAIFLGIYLYGWNRVSPRVHWWAGVAVAVSGALSGIFVVTANSWMNSPCGFRMENGHPVDIDPIAAMFNKGWLHQAIHMTIAAYMATSAAVAGVHALMLLKNPTLKFHRLAMAIPLGVACVCSLLQPLSGDLNAQYCARNQPEKLAAAEGHFKTGKRVPLRIGGIPDAETGETHYAIEIPGGLSFLAFHDFDAEVKGLDAFPRDEWPNPLVVHTAFQIMVGIGTAMMFLTLVTIFLSIRKRGLPDSRMVLIGWALTAPLGFIAIEAGWVVTEVGRQPWTIYRVLKTADAVTPMKGLIGPFITFTLLYIFMAVVVVVMLKRQILATQDGNPKDTLVMKRK